MSLTGYATLKAMEFAKSPMEGKDNRAVPGIGKAIGRRLTDAGISTASQLYDVFLQNSQSAFMQVIQGNGGNIQHQTMAYNAMQDWHNQNGCLK